MRNLLRSRSSITTPIWVATSSMCVLGRELSTSRTTKTKTWGLKFQPIISSLNFTLRPCHTKSNGYHAKNSIFFPKQEVSSKSWLMTLFSEEKSQFRPIKSNLWTSTTTCRKSTFPKSLKSISLMKTFQSLIQITTIISPLQVLKRFWFLLRIQNPFMEWESVNSKTCIRKKSGTTTKTKQIYFLTKSS